MKSFRSDCLETYVISYSYGIGDTLASRFEEAGRTAEGGGPESKKKLHHHMIDVQLE